ncbi:MAG: DUF4276 family protein [Candidatus Hydrogenedentes bacterium]|nr:DUF4276 family protein [Candidatus Hydrogenedentota bacterium]
MTVRIAPIVEGDGECEAVPILVRRIASEIDPRFVPLILRPYPAPTTRLLKTGEIERAVETAGRKLQGQGGILVIVDCDHKNGCPAIDAPALLTRAKRARKDLPISVVLAKREFEAWFLAAAESLRGKRGLPEDLSSPPNPEDIRGAKEWLSAKMSPGQGYAETTDQAALTALFDMKAARRADSFDKCYREIRGLLCLLRGSPNA